MSQFAPTLTVPVNEHDHTQGPADAPVTLVEYGDYQCPYCGQAYPIVKAVQAHFGDRLRFVFRNFPITTAHPHAEHAAEAAESAAAQGRFWEMHDQLYEHQQSLDDHHLVQFARDLGLDMDKFEADLTGHHYAQRVQDDFMSGVRSGVNGTPSFFINGARFDGNWDQSSLVEAIEAAAR